MSFNRSSGPGRRAPTSEPDWLTLGQAAKFLGVVMPGTDGWELLQRMQERHGSIPVIMFSGKVDERTAAEATKRGATSFVGKPFDPQQLVERAKQLVPV